MPKLKDAVDHLNDALAHEAEEVHDFEAGLKVLSAEFLGVEHQAKAYEKTLDDLEQQTKSLVDAERQIAKTLDP